MDAGTNRAPLKVVHEESLPNGITMTGGLEQRNIRPITAYILKETTEKELYDLVMRRTIQRLRELNQAPGMKTTPTLRIEYKGVPVEKEGRKELEGGDGYEVTLNVVVSAGCCVIL